jgi:hypothetical protein
VKIAASKGMPAQNSAFAIMLFLSKKLGNFAILTGTATRNTTRAETDVPKIKGRGKRVNGVGRLVVNRTATMNAVNTAEESKMNTVLATTF